MPRLEHSRNIWQWHNQFVKFCRFINLGLQLPICIKLWCDNQATLHIVVNPTVHEQINHNDIITL